MKKVLLTIILTLIVLILAFVAYIYSGAYNISQLAHHSKLTEKIIGITTFHSITKRVKGTEVPPLNDTAMLSMGFSHYNAMCVVCHGGAGIEPSEMAKGLYPEPPKLYKSPFMPKPDEAFWIIKNGIKLTGMPAFQPTHSDKEIWAITDFMLNKLNSMSPEEYQEWIKKYPDME